MLDPQSHGALRSEIRKRIEDDSRILDQLREEIRPLRSQVRRIQPRATTSVSLVGTDGGNNRIQFDPFLIQSRFLKIKKHHQLFLLRTFRSGKKADYHYEQERIETLAVVDLRFHDSCSF